MLLTRTLLILTSLSLLVSADANSASEDEIKAIFPKATVIGPPDANYPVTPVYQLHELLGYVFESNDLVDFPGFSGERVNLLIGLDTSGNIRGISVLNHHEPIFLHGLGPAPMQAFIDQYPGKNVSSRVIVDNAANDTNPDDSVYHVDGVTKATVSVIVISDTILLSSLQVARKLLSGFSVAPQATPKDIFTEKTWDTLLSEQLVSKFTISRTDMESALGGDLDTFPGSVFDTSRGDELTLYYAYLNAPSIGRNLLGESEYQRLMDTLKTNEQAFLVMSDGFMQYLSSDFKPGTVADTISLTQDALPFSMRDLNFFSYAEQTLAPDMPSFDNPQLFVVNTQSGFNPGQPMTFTLSLNIAKNHLSQVQVTFSDKYQLPESLFDIAEPVAEMTPEPAWVRVWKARIAEIVILSMGLVVITLIFIFQHPLSARTKLFHSLRWAMMFYTLFFVGWYAQGQLSVVNIYPILQSLIDGFDLPMYLMDPILFILWSYVFISLFIVGRGVFCGWLCPFGAMQEMVGWVAKKLRIRQLKISYKTHSRLWWIKYAILIGLVITSVFSLQLAEVASEVEPFKTAITLQFVRTWPFVVYAVLLLAAGLYMNKFYCRYVCPLGAGLGILGYFHIGEWLTRRKACGSPCTMCYHKCDIKAITPQGNVNYTECVQCLECIVYYNNDNLCPPLKKAKKAGRKQQVIPVNAAP